MTILRSPPWSPSTALAPRQRRTVRPFYTNSSVLLSRRRIALFTRPCGGGPWRPDDVDERGLGRCRRRSTMAVAAKRLLAPARAASNPLAASGGDGESERSLREVIVRAGEVLSMAFPLWVGSACVLALWKPSSFLWAHKNWQILGVTLTMYGHDADAPRSERCATDAQGVGCGFRPPIHGTASNIVTYLARGNVALSVLMTAASTFAAVIMTPSLTSKLAGQFVAVDPVGLFMSTVQVVLAPVLLGALLNQYCNSLVEFVSPLMPLVAVGSVALLCGSAIAQNASAILSSGLQVVISICCLHGSGFFFGYVLSRMLGIDVSSSRTISIEVGMQNSVLGVVLAGQHFGNPLTAVPCAVSSICQSVYGSILAGIWRRMTPTTESKD
ncbi:Sodium Bile acid symporter family [Musa troglodytarum]|uniref:Sodium Bile acid symporter family n=1 Tax=Musa troglodytarum TaxID=320322 RepID=A0A9E7EGJ6_9LILI|nr:Sodium Bile acid symporter family [Musa troglodytarum]